MQFKQTPRCSTKGQTQADNSILTKVVNKYNVKNWKQVAKYQHGRTDVECLQRWQNIFDPKLVKGAWTKGGDCLIKLVEKYICKRLSVISKSLLGCT